MSLIIPSASCDCDLYTSLSICAPCSDCASKRAQRRRMTQKLQRFSDLVLSLVLALILLPIFAVLALLIRLDSPGPTLFIQKRVGKHGRVFNFYKFRSMVMNAEQIRHQIESANERAGPVFKMRLDPRITRVGGFIRKYSLDELPQLLNVIQGDMSLVGPRPALPLEVAQYTDYERQRLAIMPGVTGLWQVSGRADLSFEESVALDLYYADHQSSALNARILWLTIPAILSGRGAY